MDEAKKLFNFFIQMSVFNIGNCLLFLFPLSWLFSQTDPCTEPIRTPSLQDWGFCLSFSNSFLHSRVGQQEKIYLWRMFYNAMHLYKVNTFDVVTLWEFLVDTELLSFPTLSPCSTWWSERSSVWSNCRNIHFRICWNYVKKNAPLILNCLLKLLEVENVGATWMLLYPHNEKAVPLIVFYPQSKHFLIHLFAFLK